jgi:hypothetical protein
MLASLSARADRPGLRKPGQPPAGPRTEYDWWVLVTAPPGITAVSHNHEDQAHWRNLASSRMNDLIGFPRWTTTI